MNDTSPELIETAGGGVTTLTLNRPDRLNPLSESMIAALQDALDRIAADPSVRVVVLTGAGRAFCAGHDLKEMHAHRDRAFQEALFERCSRMLLSIVVLPQPVVARVNGLATAAGCQLLATCDLAVASTEARIAVNGIDHGLFCSTPSVPLSRNVPRKQAFEMLFTGEFIDAETARARGLVNRVARPEELDTAVTALCDAIRAKPAATVATGKRMFYRQIERGLTEALRYAGGVMACDMMGDDAREGVGAFLEKRPPRWAAGFAAPVPAQDPDG